MGFGCKVEGWGARLSRDVVRECVGGDGRFESWKLDGFESAFFFPPRGEGIVMVSECSR